MRKHSLRQTANRYLRMDNRGSFKDKKHRAFVILKLIDDLFKIGQVPCSWQALQPHQVETLVQYWKKSKLNPVTIMRYMTIIRKYLDSINCKLDGIDNKTLGLSRTQKKHTKLNVPADIWQQINEPLSSLIMALQINLGLTFSESIHLCPAIHLKEHALWITREIAFNSEDRMIPIRNSVQQQILSQLKQLSDSQSLCRYKSIESIRIGWREELAIHGLPSNKAWRYLYAQQMYKILCPLLGNYQTNWLIRDEMGVKSRNTIWLYLNE